MKPGTAERVCMREMYKAAQVYMPMSEILSNSDITECKILRKYSYVSNPLIQKLNVGILFIHVCPGGRGWGVQV